MISVLQAKGIDKTIVVQAAPTIKETEYLLNLYHQFEFIAGVVGWLDLESASFKEDYKRLKREEGFIGIRPMLQDLNDDRWILRPKVMKNIEQLLIDDFPLDLLICPRHLPIILELLKEFPKLRAVINHAAKPDIKNGITPFWMDFMSEIASFENVMCKLSGLITEADHESWTYKEMEPFVHHLIDEFGADRLMFGSDWPVCLQAGSYQAVYELCESLLTQHMAKGSLSQVFGENANKFYKLNL